MENQAIFSKQNNERENEVKSLDRYKNFELQEENGVYFVYKRSSNIGARIGILLNEDNSLFYYSSEGMAYTHNSLMELSEFLEYLERNKNLISNLKQ